MPSRNHISYAYATSESLSFIELPRHITANESNRARVAAFAVVVAAAYLRIGIKIYTFVYITTCARTCRAYIVPPAPRRRHKLPGTLFLACGRTNGPEESRFDSS